jgi:hypothetical protein
MGLINVYAGLESNHFLFTKIIILAQKKMAFSTFHRLRSLFFLRALMFLVIVLFLSLRGCLRESSLFGRDPEGLMPFAHGMLPATVVGPWNRSAYLGLYFCANSHSNLLTHTREQ